MKKIILLLLSLFPFITGNALVYYVKPAATGGDGLSWENAITLSAALLLIVPGDEVWVSAGTYTSQGVNPWFMLSTGEVKILGGFAGTETNSSQRNWKTNTTILTATNSHVMQLASGPGDMDLTVIDGLTIQDGLQLSSGAAGIIIGPFMNPTIQNCSFINNDAGVNNGGAVEIGSISSPKFINCIFAGNRARNGGAIYNFDSGSPKIINCLFYGNVATENGGAFYSNGGFFNSYVGEIINSTFSGNLANKNGGFSGGGALYLHHTTIFIWNSILWGNGSGPVDLPQSITGISDEIKGGGSDGYGIEVSNSLTENTPEALGRNPLFGVAPHFNTAPFATGGNYTLQPGSNAINAGDNNYFPTDINPAADLAGLTRIGGGAIDLGAYESDGMALPAVFGTIGATINNQFLQVGWQTLKETNVQEYTIEGSADGVVFTALKTVPSLAKNGNSDEVLYYSAEIFLTDAASALGIAPIALLLVFCFSSYKRSVKLLFIAFLTIVATLIPFSCSRQSAELEVNTGNNLYIRIAQKDKDGSVQYSKVIKVNHP